jgi:hypothetical protein
MQTSPSPPETDDSVERYRQDGAIVLRGVFDAWVEPLRAGIDALMANPSPLERTVRPADGSAPFFQDLCNWQRIPEFEAFVYKSPAAEIAARLMGSGTARFGAGDQGRHRHLRLDRLRAADAGQGGRPVQEARPGRVDQEDPPEGPSPGHRLGRHPVRRHHGGDLGRLERQRRATTQIFQLDKSFGADGMVTKPGITKIADLKGKTVAADAPGTNPYFGLAWILKKNGMSREGREGRQRWSRSAAANAMIAGTDGIDAAMTYEPYLGLVRAKPETGKLIATTLDYPMVMDTFGCTPKFLAENPKAAKALADELLRRARPDQGRAEELRPSWAPTSSRRPSSSRSASPTCAGRTAPPTRSSSPASMPVQQGSRRPAAGDRRHQAAFRT